MKHQRSIHRLRRLRKSAAIRELVAENCLNPGGFMQPIFVVSDESDAREMAAMPGVFSYSLELLWPFLEELLQYGIYNILIFPIVKSHQKDKYGSLSRNDDFYYFEAIRRIKQKFPELSIATDVALDPYTDHGHDGIFEGGKILNDETLPLLAAMAVLQAQAGADIVAPSDMMDGRVKFIREELDSQGVSDTVIMSYSAKYASAFYGPFRDALGSDILKGDKKSYQMDFRNIDEALREAELDIAEGADIIMVKPGLAYLDVVKAFSDKFNTPIAVYNVSGEYSMIKLAANQGWIDYEKCLWETFCAFNRAGANIIISYSALKVAKMIDNNRRQITNGNDSSKRKR